jgi:hypothetical protein
MLNVVLVLFPPCLHRFYFGVGAIIVTATSVIYADLNTLFNGLSETVSILTGQQLPEYSWHLIFLQFTCAIVIIGSFISIAVAK